MAARAPGPRHAAALLVAVGVALLLATWVEGPAPPATTATPLPVPAPPPVLRLEGQAMGSPWHVIVVGPADAAVVQERVQGLFDEIDQRVSTWKADSELSRLNALPAGAPIPVSPELALLLKLSSEVTEQSGGAFDVTVGPLVEAWGFGPTPPGPAPSPTRLAALRRLVGPDRLRLYPAEGTVEKAADGVRIDLSAIAQGHAVDRAFEALRTMGLDDLLVELSGELRAAGLNPEGQPWQVGIERPDGTGSVMEAVPLGGGALATSGDYRKYREVDGQRVSHTIDPRTGHPITHGLASVTVLHPSCALADAWATALNVLGPQEGLALAEARGLPALFITRQGDGFTTTRTRSWPVTSGASLDVSP